MLDSLVRRYLVLSSTTNTYFDVEFRERMKIEKGMAKSPMVDSGRLLVRRKSLGRIMFDF